MKKEKDIKFEQPSDILIIINRYIMIFVAVIVLGVSLAGYWFFLQPKIDEIQSTEQETSETQDRKLKNESLLTKLKELEVEYKDILQNRQDDLDYLKKMVPAGVKTPELFITADRLAANRGFQLLSIDVSENIVKATPKKAAIPEAVEALGEEEVDEGADAGEPETVNDLLLNSEIKSAVIHMRIARKMETKENSDGQEEPVPQSGMEIYEDFKAYIADLENHIRLMDVQSISFPEMLEETTEQMVFNLDLITYYK